MRAFMVLVASGTDLPDKKPWEGGKAISGSPIMVLCVAWQKSWIVPGGEVRPDVRSPGVLCFTPGKKE